MRHSLGPEHSVGADRRSLGQNLAGNDALDSSDTRAHYPAQAMGHRLGHRHSFVPNMVGKNDLGRVEAPIHHPVDSRHGPDYDGLTAPNHKKNDEDGGGDGPKENRKGNQGGDIS